MDSNKLAVRMLVRNREDFQAMRKRMDNRIGRKANGEMQNLPERPFSEEDYKMFAETSDDAKKAEQKAEKNLKKVLKRFPIYTESSVSTPGGAGW